MILRWKSHLLQINTPFTSSRSSHTSGWAESTALSFLNVFLFHFTPLYFLCFIHFLLLLLFIPHIYLHSQLLFLCFIHFSLFSYIQLLPSSSSILISSLFSCSSPNVSPHVQLLYVNMCTFSSPEPRQFLYCSRREGQNDKYIVPLIKLECNWHFKCFPFKLVGPALWWKSATV